MVYSNTFASWYFTWSCELLWNSYCILKPVPPAPTPKPDGKIQAVSFSAAPRSPRSGVVASLTGTAGGRQ